MNNSDCTVSYNADIKLNFNVEANSEDYVPTKREVDTFVRNVLESGLFGREDEGKFTIDINSSILIMDENGIELKVGDEE